MSGYADWLVKRIHVPPDWEFKPDLLRKLLKQRGWTQQRLCNEVGISAERLKKYMLTSEKNRREMPVHLWAAILLTLDAHPTHQLPLGRATIAILGEEVCRMTVGSARCLVPPPRLNLTRFHGVFAPPTANIVSALVVTARRC